MNSFNAITTENGVHQGVDKGLPGGCCALAAFERRAFAVHYKVGVGDAGCALGHPRSAYRDSDARLCITHAPQGSQQLSAGRLLVIPETPISKVTPLPSNLTNYF